MTRPLQLVAGFGEPARQLEGLGKTKWVDQAILNVHDALVDNGVDSAWLPRELPRSEALRPHSVEEYGCGSYGCVMPTYQDGLVLKITTDATEAWFAHIARELARVDGWPRGIVHYRRVLGLSDQTHDGQMLYLLWRDEARSVGEAHYVAPDLEQLLEAYMNGADVFSGVLPRGGNESRLAALQIAQKPAVIEAARTYLLSKTDAGWPLGAVADAANKELSTEDTPTVVAVAILCTYLIAERIEQLAGCQALGGAIRYYLDKGILLGDLHRGNVGVAYDDPKRVVIVDPGLVSPLTAELYRRGIPRRAILRSQARALPGRTRS
jgi:hypothetical protein